eukprot:gene14106-15580_t
MSDLQSFVEESLGVELKDLGAVGGGCISNSRTYSTDTGKLFVKTYELEKGKVMFTGEFESLKALNQTNTVAVPCPIKLLDYESNKECVMIIEHVDMRSLSKYQAKLGEQLARLHLHNESLLAIKEEKEKRIGKAEHLTAVDEFGFHVPTCCGMIPQDNTWNKSWVEFYAQQKLQAQINLIQQEYQDRELEECWSELQLKISTLFKGIEIKPALVHGDLWSGNASETSSGPIIYDPASFYGHSEYDLGIAGMFGGFTKQFYGAYHALIPKSSGFEDRHNLYMLFHYLNHLNHFGRGYRSQAISIMKKLNKRK